MSKPSKGLNAASWFRGQSFHQLTPLGPVYEVIPYKVWQHPDGRRASIHGAAPGEGFVLTVAGWTVRNTRTGTTGYGGKPWDTHEDACKWADRENSRLATSFAAE